VRGGAGAALGALADALVGASQPPAQEYFPGQKWSARDARLLFRRGLADRAVVRAARADHDLEDLRATRGARFALAGMDRGKAVAWVGSPFRMSAPPCSRPRSSDHEMASWIAGVRCRSGCSRGAPGGDGRDAAPRRHRCYRVRNHVWSSSACFTGIRRRASFAPGPPP
jgi:hypothetical protein